MFRVSRLFRMISSPVLQTPKNQIAHINTQSPKREKVFKVESLNEHIYAAKYAVRGELLLRAEQLREQLVTSPGTLPFSNIIYCNIGNPQQLGQPPITFFRQVLSLLEYPALLKSKVDLSSLYPADAIARAEHLLSRMTYVGPYTNTQGLEVAREEVAKFISRRDGYAASPEDIFLTDGASPAVQTGLKLIIRGPQDGIMIPIPQYPLYSATITMLNGSMISYYLDEDNSNWGLEIKELERSYAEAVKNGVTPKALVIINPGNPTGQCLLHENQKEIVRFCVRNGLALFADEVYQENSYLSSHPFNSFKKVVMELGTEAADLELMSFHSISKGFVGECGHRGGYVELHNIDPDVKAVLYKLASISLCPNVVGQILIGLMANPPQPGEPSYELYHSEKTAILNSLSNRAEKLVKALNELEGVSCRPVEGAMYVFPKITLSRKACEAAKLEGKVPDAFYAIKLLEATGICVVPGSGFGQKEGTWHFRTTFLPREDQIDQVIEKIRVFHKSFSDLYRD